MQRSLVIIAAVLVVLLVRPLTAHAEQRIEWVKADTETFSIAERPKSVMFSAKLAPDPDLVPEAVELSRYDSEGNFVKTLGRMYDDGTQGDTLKDDLIFTAVVPFNEPAPAFVVWSVSAKYRNKEAPIVEHGKAIAAQSGETCEEANSKLANLLAAGDLSEASKFYSKDSDIELLTLIGDDERRRIGAEMKAAQIESKQGRLCQFSYKDSKGGHDGFIMWTQTALGDWVVSAW